MLPLDEVIVRILELAVRSLLAALDKHLIDCQSGGSDVERLLLTIKEFSLVGLASLLRPDLPFFCPLLLLLKLLLEHLGSHILSCHFLFLLF